MTRIIGILIAFGFAGGIAWLIGSYHRWLAYHTKRASADSKIIQTQHGPVEYSRQGEGPVVLHFHGGNVGHNGRFMLGHLVDAGFQIITPDRPGYLGTPLKDNGSPENQADLMAALLDKLGIDQVVVVGVSAGGPGALQFVLRHSHRVHCLVLLSAITEQTQLTDDQLSSTLGKLVMTRRFQKPAYFLIHQAMKRMTGLALQDFVRTETTYSTREGQRYIDKIMQDPEQMKQVHALADAMVPALPRFAGVMNDLTVQQNLDALPLNAIETPTLIVHSRNDGDVPYKSATTTAKAIPDAELITVDQFGHFIWWGDPDVTANFQRRIEAFVHRHSTHADFQ